MQTALEQYDVGVIVGRFQVHELHAAHRDLIQHVCDEHEKVIVVLGLSPLPVSKENPLDFEARKQMILQEFPEVNVLYAKDQPRDDFWSKHLDGLVSDLLAPGQTAVIYGGRDSFIDHYSGRFPTRELVQETFVSGTEIRRAIARSRAKASPDFRAGVIWASQARFPTAFQCVDIAVLNEDSTRLLLGRKHSDGRLYRFLGGFSDPNSDSLEADCIREVAEEASVEVGDCRYIGSLRVDDWRYAREPDCIKTALFTAKYLHGRPNPADDIDEVRWFDLAKGADPVGHLMHQIVPSHRPLLKMLGQKGVQ